ncbi:MAG: hypothetical protein ACI4K7_03410 [Oscillospiraceae bacterium]
MKLLSKLWKKFRNSKTFKPAVCLLIVLVLVKTTDLINMSDHSDNQQQTATETTENSPQGNSEETAEKEKAEDSKPIFHIGKGHIVMFCVFAGGYAIDKAILFHNKKLSDKKYQ